MSVARRSISLGADLAVGETAWFLEYSNTLVVDENNVPTGGIIDVTDFILGELPSGFEGYLVAEHGNNGLDFGRVGFTLTAVPSAADFNGDGDVDGDDLLAWQTGYGTGTTHEEGDADEDGDVDGRDFLTWQREFEDGTPLTASITTVPEPSTLCLGLILMAGFTGRRR